MLPVAWAGSRYPAGRYTVLWEGKGRVGFPLNRAGIHRAEPNRLVADVAADGKALYVEIEETQAAEPVRNVRVLWPGSEPDSAVQSFNPRFLEALATLL